MRRSKEEIIEQILEICNKPTNKTKIVYQANLSFHTADPYLDLLVDAGFLETFGDTTIQYRITSKGLEVLKHIKAIEASLQPADDSY